MLEVNACRDRLDERDYEYAKVFKEEMVGSTLPEKMILDHVEYQNQGLEEITKNMCVFYSTAHVSNEENFQEGSDVRVEGKDLGLVALDLGRLDVEVGAYVSDGPRTARDEGLIKGWTKAKTIDDIKHSISKKRPLVVGSDKIKWSSGYRKPFVLTGNKGSGHAVAIIGYDDNYEGGCFVIKNSYGTNKFDSGKMYLPYKDLGLLFPSKYSLIDSEDPIIAYKKLIMSEINIPKAKEAFELGIWNGKDAEKPASREEVATMILRTAELAKEGKI